MKPDSFFLCFLLIMVSVALSGCAAGDALLASQGLPTAAGRSYLYGQRTLDATPPAHSPLTPDADSALVVGWGATLSEGLKSAISY